MMPLRSGLGGDQGYCKDEDEIRKFEDEEQFKDDCRWVRDVFWSKPHLAEMFIAIRMRCVLIKDYAESIGVDENTVGHRLARVEKNSKKSLRKASDLTVSHGYWVEG